MKDLPPQAAALLARARAEHEPSARQLASTLDKLHQSLEFAPESVPLPRKEPTISTHTVARGGGLTMRAKAVWLTVAIGGLFVVGASVVRPEFERRGPEAAPSLATWSAARADEPAVPDRVVAADLQPTNAPPDLEPSTPAVPGPTARTRLPKPERPVRHAVDAPRPNRERARTYATMNSSSTTDSSAPGSTPTQPSDGSFAARIDLDRSSWDELEPPMPSELELIDDALSSLRDHNAKRSLSLLAQHEKQYPDGMLATERRGLRVLALCALGDRVRAARERAAYLSTAAQTPLAERVRRTCRPEGEP